MQTFPWPCPLAAVRPARLPEQTAGEPALRDLEIERIDYSSVGLCLCLQGFQARSPCWQLCLWPCRRSHRTLTLSLDQYELRNLESGLATSLLSPTRLAHSSRCLMDLLLLMPLTSAVYQHLLASDRHLSVGLKLPPVDLLHGLQMSAT